MKKFYCGIIATMLLTGCSLQDVNVEKNENSKIENEIVNDSNGIIDGNETNSISEEKTINKFRPKIGEQFTPEGMLKSGGYLTIDSAEIFDDLKSAGIEEQDLLPSSLLRENGETGMLQTMPEGELTVAYDKDTGKMINGWKIVKVHYTFENHSAVSVVNDFIVMPEEQYTDDVFMVHNLNVCDKDDGNMVSKTNYFCYNQIYFSLADSVEWIGKPNHQLFSCPSGETVEFDIAYAFCCEPDKLYMSATSGNKTSTMVDLELGGDS